MSDVYPKKMVHPAAQKSVIVSDVQQGSSRSTAATGGALGTPDKFPPVTINNATQESYYRAQGYHASGETIGRGDYYDFPMYLQHASLEPVQVKSQTELEAREAEGYFAPGKSNPDAFERASAVPYDPEQVHEEYPKMVNGAIVDPNKPSGFQKYPMWLDGKLVHSEAEELTARGTEKAEPIQPKAEPKKRHAMTEAQKAAMAAGRARAKAERQAAA